MLKTAKRILSLPKYTPGKPIDELERDFGIEKPKFIMSGINPHNGENGVISQEDDLLLKPIIATLRKLKINIDGPISPDAIVNKKNLKHYNCFIFN